MRARLAALSLSLLLLSACNGGQAPEPAARPVVVESPQPLAGEAAEVFPGTVTAREEADLAFRVAGKILRRHVDAGAILKPGTLLAELDPEDARLNTASAQANVAAAEADARLAEAELSRHRELLDQGFISKSLFEVRENSYKLAQARLEQARSQLAVIRNQAGYTRLLATSAGVVTAVLAEAGQVVNAGQPVFRVATEGAHEVLINVPEGRLDAFRRATDLKVRLWAQPGRLYEARVREITPQAERATRTHPARVSILNGDESVRLGMTAAVLMGERLEGGIFAVPGSALGEHEGQPTLWRVGDDSRLSPVAVTVVRYSEHGVIVQGPLSATDRVVTAGVHLLHAGQTVTPLQREREG
jgi:membrane fusion protein, multidrug efflux system